MPQRRRQSAGKRRAYDQAKDTRSARPRGGANRARSGYQEQTISIETPRPAQRSADNSIEFPQQQTRRRAQQSRGSARSGQRAQNNTRQRQNQGAQRSGRLRPAAADLQSPAVRERRKKRRVTRAEMRRRRFARRVTAFLLLLGVIAAGVYLTVTMLFKISSLEVQTADGAVVAEASGYSSEQILQALGVQSGDNIFSFDPAAKAAALEKVFPLLERISVERRYPSAVVVRVSEAVPAWAMQTESGWLTISETLKIISESAEQPTLPTLYGGEPLSRAAGDQLAFEAAVEAASGDLSEASASGSATDTKEARLEALDTLLAALQSRSLLADVTRIEFADTEQIAFAYQNRISVLLGTLNELDYKLDFAQYLLLNTDGKGCAATDTGELDCSHVRSDGTLRPIFAQGAPTLPSGYDVTAQPVAAAKEETPVEETATEQAPAEGEAAG